MTEFERNEIEKLPYKYRPMSAWGYFGYSLLFLIPVAGFIFLLVFSFSDEIGRASCRERVCMFV